MEKFVSKLKKNFKNNKTRFLEMSFTKGRYAKKTGKEIQNM